MIRIGPVHDWRFQNVGDSACAARPSSASSHLAWPGQAQGAPFRISRRLPIGFADPPGACSEVLLFCIRQALCSAGETHHSHGAREKVTKCVTIDGILFFSFFLLSSQCRAVTDEMEAATHECGARSLQPRLKRPSRGSWKALRSLTTLWRSSSRRRRKTSKKSTRRTSSVRSRSCSGTATRSRHGPRPARSKTRRH